MSTRSTYTIVLSLYISLFYDTESITGCFAMLMVPTLAQRSLHTAVSVITNDYPNPRFDLTCDFKVTNCFLKSVPSTPLPRVNKGSRKKKINLTCLTQ